MKVPHNVQSYRINESVTYFMTGMLEEQAIRRYRIFRASSLASMAMEMSREKTYSQAGQAVRSIWTVECSLTRVGRRAG